MRLADRSARFEPELRARRPRMRPSVTTLQQEASRNDILQPAESGRHLVRLRRRGNSDSREQGRHRCERSTGGKRAGSKGGGRHAHGGGERAERADGRCCAAGDTGPELRT